MSTNGPVLVTGAGGLLGGCVTAALARAGVRVESAGRDKLDITDSDAVRRVVLGLRPWAIVHCAALTNVDGCEKDPDGARAVNTLACAHLARAASDAGAELLSVSTDYVFDGRKGEPYTEDDPTNPIQSYGRTKLEGEDVVREILPAHYIVRSAWIYGSGGKNFASRIFDYAEHGAVRAVADQTSSPTYAPDLAAAIVELLESGRYGTYHITNSGQCTWADLVRCILAEGGVEASVQDIASASLELPAPRPESTPLANDRWIAEGFAPLREWRAAARDFAQAEVARRSSGDPAAGAPGA